MGEGAPLAHINVLDLSQGIAGPSCGGYFSEYGAHVIKVEPPGGDWVRRLGTDIEGASAQHHAFNRGKRSVAIDLKAAEGAKLALRLAGEADVVIEGARPGVFERLGLGFEAVRAVSPHIVYVSISGYGQSGPNAKLAMVDTIGQAQSGMMDVTRGREGHPTKLDTQVIDVVTGLYAFQAASMAIMGDKATRAAKHLDISLMQSGAAFQAANILEWSSVGKAPGLLNPPAGNYPTADGWLAVTLVTEAQFVAIAKAIGRPELPDDERFATFGTRKGNVAALRAIIDEELAKRTTAEWVERFAAAGALASQINSYGDWLDDPHVRAVDAASAFEVSPARSVRIPRLPGAPAFNAPAPGIGEHSRDVLRAAGIDAGEIDALIACGVIAQAGEAGGQPS